MICSEWSGGAVMVFGAWGSLAGLNDIKTNLARQTSFTLSLANIGNKYQTNFMRHLYII